jgi:hypothetical protein
LVARLLWEQDVAGSNPVTPIHIHNTTMNFYSVEYWQENWEELMEQVESGKSIGVVNKNGEKAVMVPADDELIRIHVEENNDAQ